MDFTCFFDPLPVLTLCAIRRIMNYHYDHFVIQMCGLGDNMQSTITARGQTVIPAEIRRRFQLDPSKKLEWIVDENGITVVPVEADPIDAFRGQGRGGSVDRLLNDRKRDRVRE